jgi:RimJ/RimL family protein N-acetyltransferase
MIEFFEFEERHLVRFREWLNQEHIKPVWQETDDDSELKEKFLNQLPARGVYPYVFTLDRIPIGYIQYYEAKKVGGGWWENEKPGTFGVDLLIGDEKDVGKGLGPNVIRQFIELMKTRESKMTSVIIDPDPKNKSAIRAFEKAGFRIENEIATPGGAALLMRLTFK